MPTTSELSEARIKFTRLGVDGEQLADDEFVGALQGHLLSAAGTFASLLKSLGISELRLPEAFRWLAELAEREIDVAQLPPSARRLRVEARVPWADFMRLDEATGSGGPPFPAGLCEIDLYPPSSGPEMALIFRDDDFTVPEAYERQVEGILKRRGCRVLAIRSRWEVRT